MTNRNNRIVTDSDNKLRKLITEEGVSYVSEALDLLDCFKDMGLETMEDIKKYLKYIEGQNRDCEKLIHEISLQMDAQLGSDISTNILADAVGQVNLTVEEDD